MEGWSRGQGRHVQTLGHEWPQHGYGCALLGHKWPEHNGYGCALLGHKWPEHNGEGA